MTCQEWLTREQTARKRDERNDRDMQDAGRRSEEENAAASEQSTESPEFSETSFVQVVLKEEERREQVVGGIEEVITGLKADPVVMQWHSHSNPFDKVGKT